MVKLENKILATLGPSSLNERCVQEMAAYGVSLFRINLSHTSPENLEEIIGLLRSWTAVPICLDSEGAQLRNGQMKTESTVYLEGSSISIFTTPVVGDSTQISFNPKRVCEQLRVGDEVRVDFDNVKFFITDKCDDYFVAKVTSGGKVGANKASDVNRKLQFDCLTAKDKKAIKIGLENGVKNFALSFTNRAKDVDELRKICGEESNIICKIESRCGVKNLEGILEKANAILIDRGDLSREISIELIPFMQREIIALACQKNKPVFVATNLLENMITSKNPTRAEVNDVVSTLEMGASGLVLAAETAIGAHPIEAVKMINALIRRSESWKTGVSLQELLGS